MHKNCDLENDWCDWCSVESIVCLENGCDVCLEKWIGEKCLKKKRINI